MSPEEIGRLLDAIAAVAEPARLAYLWRPILPDPDDDLVLEAAVNGRADFLVTFNRRDFQRATERFALPIASPGEALERLKDTL